MGSLDTSCVALTVLVAALVIVVGTFLGAIAQDHSRFGWRDLLASTIGLPWTLALIFLAGVSRDGDAAEAWRRATFRGRP